MQHRKNSFVLRPRETSRNQGGSIKVSKIRVSRSQSHGLAVILAILFLFVPAAAQKKKPNYKVSSAPQATAVMWEPVSDKRDLYLGPGGLEMAPDLSRIKFIKKESGGTQRKYRIEDGSGRIWDAKLGRETRPETAAVRMLYGLGYKTECNYLIPELTMTGKGTYSNSSI